MQTFTTEATVLRVPGRASRVARRRTTAHGKRLTGRDEIASFTRQVLPGAAKEATATYEVAHVLFIRPDVAAVKIRQRPVRPDGTAILDQNEGSPLYILSKEDGAWRIAAGQNTIVL